MVKLETIIIESTEHTILIGQNAEENSTILRECDPEDIWFHLKHSSSPHIILRTSGQPIQKRYLKTVASLIYKYKKQHTREPVIYTQVKNVQLTKTPGLVYPRCTKEIKY
jgi:predicted ribosome quality control (RQC) complex YloA/Tae2 family protein